MFYSLSDNVAILFIDMIQNLTTLKILDFGTLVIQKEETDDLFYNKVSNIQKVGGLESLSLTQFDVATGDDSMKKLNLLLSFMLRFCPNLKKIKPLVHSILARGGMNLDFRGNPLLQDIDIKMLNCQYYAFHHEFGKYWRNIKEEIKRDDFTMNSFFVNLAWDYANKNIRLQLAGCDF